MPIKYGVAKDYENNTLANIERCAIRQELIYLIRTGDKLYQIDKKMCVNNIVFKIIIKIKIIYKTDVFARIFLAVTFEAISIV